MDVRNGHCCSSVVLDRCWLFCVWSLTSDPNLPLQLQTVQSSASRPTQEVCSPASGSEVSSNHMHTDMLAQYKGMSNNCSCAGMIQFGMQLIKPSGPHD